MKKIKSENFDKYTKFLILVAVFVISGIFGFIYETIFYKIDLGYFVKRGSTVGPWIPIYAYGGLFVTLLTRKYKKNPLLVFVISTVICGILEFSMGYILLNVFHTRAWNYNIEIWNFGNIGGFICLRSVLFFGASSLFLMYGIIPFVKSMALKFNKITFSYITLIPGVLFLIDIIYSNIHFLINFF